jgi:hypothetical protein
MVPGFVVEELDIDQLLPSPLEFPVKGVDQVPCGADLFHGLNVLSSSFRRTRKRSTNSTS